MFFFQAEDGIRDLVRSRGLGDVYKRQGHTIEQLLEDYPHLRYEQILAALAYAADVIANEAVSYTHLTLPTSDLV